MPSNMYETYAEKICRYFDMPAATYQAPDLAHAVLHLPLAESHAALDGRELEDLPRLGETLTVQEHVQGCFFDVIGMPGRQLFESTVPVLVRRDRLERLEGWREWKVLQVFLEPEFLEPAMVFRNSPMRLRTGDFEKAEYYVADVRIIPGRPQPFVWAG